MLIVHAKPNRQDIKQAVLCCENSKHDYLLNHIVNIVSDVEDPADRIAAQKANKLSFATQRRCFVKTITVNVKLMRTK